MNTTIRDLLLSATLWCATTSTAQTPLMPMWIHTWPYGPVDPIFTGVDSQRDNQLAIDPATERLYCLVNDANSLYSPMWELVNAFDLSGNDLTPTPPLVIGRHGSTFPNNDLEGTLSFAVHDGALWTVHLHHDPLMPLGNYCSMLLTRSSSRYCALSLGQAAEFGYGLYDVIADSTGAIAAGHYGPDAAISALDTAGHIRWVNTVPGLWASALTRVGGVICAVVDGLGYKFNAANGTNLGSFPLPSVPINDQWALATNGTELYYATFDLSAHELTWGRRTLAGVVVWERTLEWPDGFRLSALRVDDDGGAWVGGSEGTVGAWEGGRVIGTALDGSTASIFSYGAMINDLEVHDSTLYATGWSDTTGTETFLIAANPDFAIGLAPSHTTRNDLILRPVPASDVLFIDHDGTVTSLLILEPGGRTIRTINGSERRVAVTDLAPGSYLLRAATSEGPITRPFVIAR